MNVVEKHLQKHKSNLQAMAADKDSEKRIFVKGFPRETTENDLKTFFETYGTVKHVNIVKDHKSGLAKYGFVTFESKDVRETLCQEKSIKFQDKTLCIWKAFRRQSSAEKNSDGAAHGFRRYFPSRQSSLDYSSSTAPMAYYVWPFYNQNPIYVPAVQASAVAQISPPSYQTSYIPSNPQVFTTLMPGSPSTSTFVQSLNSAEQFLLPMPRTNYVEGYTDYQTIPSIITLPMTPGNEWPSTESGMSIFSKEGMLQSPKTKGKKTFQSYGGKEEEENSDAASEAGSHIPVAAVLPTGKEIISP